MIKLKIFNKNIDPLLANKIIIGFAIGLFIPITAWIIDFNIKNLSFTFSNFAAIHAHNPTLIILELIPFVIAIVIYYLSVIREKEQRYFKDIINERDEKINRNAKFAQQIGEGNYETDFDMFDSDDILAKSLMVMRDNLLENYEKEAEQNWISEGKDLISGILRMHNKIDVLSYDVITNLIRYINVIQGALYIYNEETNTLDNVATYAYNRKKFINQSFKIGQGLIGQAAYEMDYIYRKEIPENYVTITSGILGDQKPKSLLIVPLVTDEKLQGVIEFASLENEIPELKITYLRELGEIIARTIFNLKVNSKTEKLLLESQEMTRELQENEEQLRQNAEEMRATQEELEKSNIQLEKQIKEVENAQKRLNSLLENASEIIMIYDKNLHISFVSPSVNKILGFSPDEIMRGKDMERLTRKGEMELREMLNTLLKNPSESLSIQYTYIKKDGKKIFLETTGLNMLEDNAIQGIILNSQDITSRKRAEKEERLRSRMQSLSENSLDMIIRLNSLGQFFYANPVVESYLGLKPLEIMNKRLKELHMDEVFTNYFLEVIEEIKANPKKVNKEIVISLTRNGEKEDCFMNMDAIPEFSENENELETILIVGHDITEAKRIEQEIQEKNKKIEDSINYAQRIQTSILPSSKTIHEIFKDSFIFYKPRDMVSGDFPWFFQKSDNIYIAAVDCTGHGVPGALLSFIGYFTLNNVVDHDEELTASEIVDRVHFSVRATLNQDKPDAQARDGMDIAFCKINLNKKELQFAGAHRPLYLLRKGELIEYKGDRKAIGGIPHHKKEEQNFTNHVINIEKGDKIFFFSDGLPDQIGGENGEKYTAKKMREIISANPDIKMSEYYDYFATDFVNWSQGYKQIDDVLLIGIKF